MQLKQDRLKPDGSGSQAGGSGYSHEDAVPLEDGSLVTPDLVTSLSFKFLHALLSLLKYSEQILQ